jgi:RNA helicase.
VQYVIKEESRVDGPFHKGLPNDDLDAFITKISKSKKTNNNDQLDAIKELIDQGKTSKEIADANFSQWVRHHRAFEQYRLLKTTPRSCINEVVVIFGPTGTGKSHYCLDKYPNSYWKTRGQWWDGYSNHDSIIIDEFYGWMPWDMLLRLCDKYPLLLETKGGTVQFIGTRIVFTTNKHPSQWYTETNGLRFATFSRRVTEWVVAKEMNNWLHLSTYDEFRTRTEEN